MKVLHISVAGIVDKFYLQFFTKLKQNLNIEETIYIPYSKKGYDENEKKIINGYYASGIQVVALSIKKNIDRILYRKKIKKYERELIKKIDINEYDIIHAHSLFSDGGVAYLLNKRYEKPYVVAVRTTDINVFLKYFPFIKPFGRRIIDNAQKVVFITPSIKEQLLNNLYSNEKIFFPDKKGIIIPNGINDYWIRNKCTKPKSLKSEDEIRLIQIGRLNDRKKVDIAIKAVRILNDRGINATLDVLGEGENRQALTELIKELHLEKCVYLHGFVSDLDRIKEYCANSDIFVMASSSETFGLVYVEAMSQGLPIIGISGTGVSAYFEQSNVGEFILKPDETMVADAVQRIMNNYTQISNNALNGVDKFNWNDISEQYGCIYEMSVIERI